MKEKFLNGVWNAIAATSSIALYKFGIFLYIPEELSAEDAKWVANEVKKVGHCVVDIITPPNYKKPILLISSF